MNNDTVTISRAEYEGLLKANEELTKQVEIVAVFPAVVFESSVILEGYQTL